MSEPMLPIPCLSASELAGPAALGRRVAGGAAAMTEQVAKDFESVLLHKVLQSMKDTIGDWGLDEDETGKQTRDLFWMYLARDLAERGGFGLWKDIRHMVQQYQAAAATDAAQAHPAEEPR